MPAPTRTLYGASKAAGLMLFRSLAIENPRVSFSFILPATVEGDFRASAVDGGKPREVLKGALKQEYVAERVVTAIDKGTKVLFLPQVYSVVHIISWLFPWIVERGARRKYNFS